MKLYEGKWCPYILGGVKSDLVGLLAVVVRLGEVLSLIVVVGGAGVRETGGLAIVDVVSIWGVQLSILTESSSLLLKTASFAVFHVGIVHFMIVAGLCTTAARAEVAASCWVGLVMTVEAGIGVPSVTVLP